MSNYFQAYNRRAGAAADAPLYRWRGSERARVGDAPRPSARLGGGGGTKQPLSQVQQDPVRPPSPCHLPDENRQKVCFLTKIVVSVREKVRVYV